MSHCTHWEDRGEVCCMCGRLFPHDEWPPGHGVPCTPENVECPDCEGAVAEAIKWRDWQSLDMGVTCDKHTPENVEEP